MYEVVEESDFGSFYILPLVFRTEQSAREYCNRMPKGTMHYWYRKKK